MAAVTVIPIGCISRCTPGGVHWLADPGTGSYVAPDLFWYRSTLAHNAPRVDGVSQPMADARAEMFDASGRWSWVRGKFRGLTRTIVTGPTTLVDVLEFAADEEHLVELPWHPEGDTEILTPGRWEPAQLDDAFAHDAERFVPQAAGQIAWRAVAPMGKLLEGIFDEPGELLRARAPARPGRSGDHRFLIRRGRGRYVRFASVLAFDRPALRSARFAPGEIVVEAEGRWSALIARPMTAGKWRRAGPGYSCGGCAVTCWWESSSVESAGSCTSTRPPRPRSRTRCDHPRSMAH